MDSAKIRAVNDSHKQVQRFTYRTLLSLLRSFNIEESLFNGSIQEHAADAADPSFRDTAAILMAIEEARDIMSRPMATEQSEMTSLQEDKLRPAREAFEKELNNNLKGFDGGNLSPIPYNTYRSLIFDPILRTLATMECVDWALGREAENGKTPRPFEEREGFTCACILALLNTYPQEHTHGKVYMEALDTVLKALVRSSSPHYAFGGASLTGDQPHAFIAYKCLYSLNGLAEIIATRAKEHSNLADLLEQVIKWASNEDYSIRKIYPTDESFGSFMAARVRQFENTVGLTHVITELRRTFPVNASSQSAEQLRSSLVPQLVEALGEEVNWLNNFSSLVDGKLEEINLEVGRRCEELATFCKGPTGACPRDVPGRASMELAGDLMNVAGIVWRKAFFEGMQHVLQSCRSIYNRPNCDDLKELANRIREAGQQWSKSAQRTGQYIAKFAKWARAELNRQISLYSADAPFDPVQLAFALRIYRDIDRNPDKDLLARGLQIVLDSQKPDGTWPAGAPFVFDRHTLAAVHVANLEIMNAIMPLLTKENLALNQSYAHRVFKWLERNRHEIKPENAGQAFVGWSTDRIFGARRIDLWATAAALRFLVSYRKLLQDSVNLEIGQTYDFSRPQFLWSDLVDAELERPYSQRVTTEIYEQYIRAFKETGESTHSAMVLHGPPGTAKSTLAKAIAAELGWNLVIITPSDFVRDGIEMSENAARNVFKDLSILREVVVLFDEIDEMLRDRKEAEGGIAMLRFLIPGMLPKLQELKQSGEKNRLIFIVATNYEDHLDSAIVRSGRIDTQFAVVPPDKDSRNCLIRRFLRGKKPFIDWNSQERGSFASFLAGKTNGWVYKELEHLVNAIQVSTFDTWKASPPIAEKELTQVLHVANISDECGLERYKILERQASLDVCDFYAGRPRAISELKRVLRSFGIKDDNKAAELATSITKEKARVTPQEIAA